MRTAPWNAWTSWLTMPWDIHFVAITGRSWTPCVAAASSAVKPPSVGVVTLIGEIVESAEGARRAARCLRSLRVALYLIVSATSLAAQEIVGYTPRAASAQRTLEQSVVRRPDSSRAATYSRALSARSHISGTPAQAITRDYVLDRMREWGLETTTREYEV